MDYYCQNCDIIMNEKDEVISDWFLDPWIEDLIVVYKCPHCEEVLEEEK